MRDRVMLSLAVVLLVVGVGAWAFVARDAPVDDRALLLARLGATPPVGAPPPDGDARPATTRAALEGVGVSPTRVRELLLRQGEPVYGLGVPGREAVALFDGLYAARARTGLVPVILGDGHSVDRHAEAARTTSAEPAAILRRAENIDADAWVRARLLELSPSEGVAREPEGDARDRFVAIGDPLLGLPLYELGLALVPTSDGAEALAWLSFGNWRGCPEPAVHVAILRALRERVGAQVVVVSADRIDLRVASPPQDAAGRRDTAGLLAAYSPSVLTRSNGTARTLQDVAAEVVPSRVWSLSWPRP